LAELVVMKFTVLCRSLDSQKRGFVPPGYLHHLQHHQQRPLQASITSHPPGYATYGHLGESFFPTGGSEERARSTATGPEESSPDGSGYATATVSSPPTPPVTPGNRHQLSLHQHQQQLGAGHMSLSISPSGNCLELVWQT